jgi:hypothetical protein
MSAPTIEALYTAHPELYAAEHNAEHRVEGRRRILGLLDPGTIGVELGVFTGLFSEVILETVRPAVLHLVDPWWSTFGETYPDWGAYTDHGRLPTRVAYEATLARVARAAGDCDVEVHVATSAEWLGGIADASLDWAYVDSTHYYRETLEELQLLVRKVRRGGLVLGDDWRPNTGDPHHGVFRAVHEQVRAGVWDVIRVDEHVQWAVRHAVGYPTGERHRATIRRLLRRA